MYFEATSCSIFLILIISKCDSYLRELDIQERITGDDFAKIEDFPYAAALQEKRGVSVLGIPIGVWFYICGATIVHINYALTTSECYDVNSLGWRLIVGTEYVSVVWEDDDNIATVKDMKLISSHRYSTVLIILEAPLVLSETVEPIKLSTFHDDDDHKMTDLTVAGWGASSQVGSIGPYTRSRYLKYAKVKMCPKNKEKDHEESDDEEEEDEKEEEKKYNNSSTLDFGYLHEHIICTTIEGDDGSGPCTGDAGNGLVVQVKGTKYLHGIHFNPDRFHCKKHYYFPVSVDAENLKMIFDSQ